MELEVPGLPFTVVPSHTDVWRLNESDEVVAQAPAHTDFYVNPGGADSADAESMLNAAFLVGRPPAGDFQLSARVSVEFRAQYDAGVLLLWIDDSHWAKLCFELSPDSEPMVVSVVTRELSDDANAFTVPARWVWLRVSRIKTVYAYHASTDGKVWKLIRVFSLGDDVSAHRIGFEAQAPTGDGCTVTFTDISFTAGTLEELRDGS
jgi:regulation of enolase protein 1 (concanavalin A-like superfamily)